MSQPPPGISQRMLNEVAGTLLIGSWIRTLVLMFQVTRIYRYFKLYPVSCRRTDVRAPPRASGHRQDHAWIPIMILWMLALDLVSTVIPYVMAYTWLVSGWGNPAMLGTNSFLIVPYTISSALCILTMHLFLLSRYYTLSRRAVVSVGLLCMALVSCGWFIVAGVLSGILYRTERARMKTAVTAWLISTVVTDWSIAGSLMWTLSRLRTTIDDTQGMITRIIRLSVLSGSVPTVLILICLIAFMLAPDANYSMIVSQSLGSAASLTVLYNLNSRGVLASSTRNTPGTFSTGHVVSTTVGRGQLFGGTLDGWSAVSAGEGIPMRSPGTVSGNRAQMLGREEIYRRGVNQPNVDLDMKPAVDF